MNKETFRALLRQLKPKARIGVRFQGSVIFGRYVPDPKLPNLLCVRRRDRQFTWISYQQIDEITCQIASADEEAA